MQDDQRLPNVTSPRRVARRRLLQAGGIIVGSTMAAGGAFLPTARAAGVPAARVPALADLPIRAIPTSRQADGPLALSEPELATLRAMVGRLIPSDDLGPGADEAGVDVFIDRALAGPYAASLPRYRATLAALAAAAGDGGFVAAAPERQDDLLTQLEIGSMPGAPDGAFAMVLEHTRQGMFGDPVYGGNVDFAGWDLIGYPGIKLLWTEAEQALDATVQPLHLSVAQFGRSGW